MIQTYLLVNNVRCYFVFSLDMRAWTSFTLFWRLMTSVVGAKLGSDFIPSSGEYLTKKAKYIGLQLTIMKTINTSIMTGVSLIN